MIDTHSASISNSPAPLLDRDLFFGESDTDIRQARISPDGQHIAFIKPYKGVANIWVKPATGSFDDARPISADAARPIPGYFWSHDSQFILYVQDAAGDENYNIYAIAINDEIDAETGVPATRALTALSGVLTQIYSLPKTRPGMIYIGLNDRDPQWHDLYELEIATGKKELLRLNTENISSWFFDHAGTLRLAIRVTVDGGSELLRVDANGLTRIIDATVYESQYPYSFTHDNSQIFLVTNRGDINLIELHLLNPETGETSKIESDPENEVDFGDLRLSESDQRLQYTSYIADRQRYYFYDQQLAQGFAWLTSQLPEKEINLTSRSLDEKLWLVSANSSTEPGETYLWNREAGSLQLQYRQNEALPREYLANTVPYRYASVDGLQIPAYLTLPKGVAAEQLPLVVLVHGGPWSRDTLRFDALAQFLANRGYAVLQPNFRGSSGYGKKFLNAGNREWHNKMQDDLTWGIKALVKTGIVDPTRVGIAGGSYGGYAALAGVAFNPDLYAAAVSIVGPSNLITLLETIPPYWQAIRTIFNTRLADPTTEEGRKWLAQASPLNRAHEIKAPLLVVQGKHDPRVKQTESDQIVAAARDNNLPVQYLIADDEGHGFQRPINLRALGFAIEAFLEQHLGGRAQTDVPTDVAQKLAELNVNLANVLGSAATTPEPALS